MTTQLDWYFNIARNSTVIPNMQRLQQSLSPCRRRESSTRRSRASPKTAGIAASTTRSPASTCPRGSWDGRVIDQIAPGDDEIWLPKTSSSVFVSTHIDYILRNLGVKQLVMSQACSPINASRAPFGMPAISAISSPRSRTPAPPTARNGTTIRSARSRAIAARSRPMRCSRRLGRAA